MITVVQDHVNFWDLNTCAVNCTSKTWFRRWPDDDSYESKHVAVIASLNVVFD